MKNFSATGNQYIVSNKWIRLLSYDPTKPLPKIGNTANSLILPQGSTVTKVKSVVNQKGIPFIYFTVNNISQIKKQGSGNGGNVSVSTVYTSEARHFTQSSSADGSKIEGYYVTAEDLRDCADVESFSADFQDSFMTRVAPEEMFPSTLARKVVRNKGTK